MNEDSAFDDEKARQYEALLDAVKPFANLVLTSTGRIPVERLSLADWHNLVIAWRNGEDA